MVRCTFSQPPPMERAGQTTGGSFLRIFIKVTQGHPRSIIKEKHQKSTFCTFLRTDGALHVLATTTNLKSGSNYRWVFSPNFNSGHTRSPKVNYQGKTPKIELLYLFTERWCVARSRNHHQWKERVKLQVGLSSEFSLRSPKVTQGQYQGKTPKIDFLYLFTERWCVARSRNHHQSKERVKLQVGLFSEF